MAIDVTGMEAVELVAPVVAAQDRFVAAVGDLSDVALGQPSGLPGWTRAEVVAHVAYGAAAGARITESALRGGSVSFYPGGPKQREASIRRARTMAMGELRAELADASAALAATWRALAVRDWNHPLVDDRFPGASIARHLMLRWTEVEVHRDDLVHRSDWRTWSPSFVAHALALRVA